MQNLNSNIETQIQNAFKSIINPKKKEMPRRYGYGVVPPGFSIYEGKKPEEDEKWSKYYNDWFTDTPKFQSEDLAERKKRYQKFKRHSEMVLMEKNKPPECK